jgi:4'-phosphopantetheinyl transferase
VRVTDLPPRLAIEYGVRPAHDLLREVAARFHQVPTSHVVLSHECLRCGSHEHGRPVLLATAAIRRPAYVSLARAGDVSVVAVTDAGRAGIDVEAEGAAEFEGFAGVALHQTERASGTVDPTLAWVRKEAVLKACGLGLVVDPGDLHLDETGIVAWDSPYPSPGNVWLRDVDVPRLVIAVAILPDLDLAGLSVTVRSATD